MKTTTKSIHEQIQEVHKLFDDDLTNNEKTPFWCLHNHDKEIIKHVMKLQAKVFYIEKKIDILLSKTNT